MKTGIKIVCMTILAGLGASCATPEVKTAGHETVSAVRTTPAADITREQAAPLAVASGSQKASAAAATGFAALDSWLAKNSLAITAGRSKIFDYDRAFAQGAVLAYGEGYPVADAAGTGKKRLTAIRAAEVVAQRNLAEFFARHASNGEISFNNHSTKLEAFLNGAYVAASEYNAELGKAAVLVKRDLGGAKNFAR